MLNFTKIRNFTKNAKFSEISDFLTFPKCYSFWTPPEGEKPWHQVKVTALGEEIEENHPFSPKTTILMKKAEMAWNTQKSWFFCEKRTFSPQAAFDCISQAFLGVF